MSATGEIMPATDEIASTTDVIISATGEIMSTTDVILNQVKMCVCAKRVAFASANASCAGLDASAHFGRY